MKLDCTSEKSGHILRCIRSFGIWTIMQFALSGCGFQEQFYAQDDLETLGKRSEIRHGMMVNPDTDAWREQRQQIAQALGQRDYDAHFSRTFDSLVLAVSSLELRVKNMERQSGYVTASGSFLPATEKKAMHKKKQLQWAVEKGYDPAILDKPLRSKMISIGGMEVNNYDWILDGGTDGARAPSLTFQLVKLGDNRTRVKANFSNVFFPDEMQRCYELIWQAVDKQIFVDENIDGKFVEDRK